LSLGAVAGGFADGDAVTAWLDDGMAPNQATGRVFTKGSLQCLDLTFAAPKSVSLVRALTTDVAEKVVAEAHLRAVTAAMEYLHQHAGYTRVHNPGRLRSCPCGVYSHSRDKADLTRQGGETI